MTLRGAQTSLARRVNEQAIVDTLLREGPLTRVDLATRLALSKPTVNTIMRGLEAANLVTEDGQVSGRVGRSATLYRVNHAVGHCIALDVGGHNVTAACSDLLGDIKGELRESTETSTYEALCAQLERLVHEATTKSGVEISTVFAVSLSVPGVVHPETKLITSAPNLPVLNTRSLAEDLGRHLDAPVETANDVNLSALAERWRGNAQQASDFAFLAIGTGLGCGLVLDGELVEGKHGAAGEIGWLPFGTDPFDPAVADGGPLEYQLSGPGAMRRFLTHCHHRGSHGVTETRDVFELARSGDQCAGWIVDDTARLIAMACAALATSLDLELLVLGGPIGSVPELLEPAQSYLTRLVPREVFLVSSSLADRAGLLGALVNGLIEARLGVMQSGATPAAARRD